MLELWGMRSTPLLPSLLGPFRKTPALQEPHHCLKDIFQLKNLTFGLSFLAIWFWFVWVLWHINPCKLFNVNSIFIQINSSFKTIQFCIRIVFYTLLNVKTLLFQTIQFSVQKHFCFKQLSLAKVCSLNIKTVLFQANQFSISAQFSSIWCIDRTLSGAITPANEGVLAYPKASVLLESHIRLFVWYPGHT